MRHERPPRRVFVTIAAVALALAIAAISLWQWHSRTEARRLRLPDGTEAWFLPGSRVTPAAAFPRPREIRVDGDIYFRVPASPQPLIVRSRLLVITVQGKAAFRITAYSRESGEQIEMLYGNAIARKAYPSPWHEPDTLTGGEMLMINRTIDLAEKEKCDLEALRSWADGLVASTAS